MPLISRLSALWRNLTHRGRIERDLDDEIRATLEILVTEQVQSGLTPEEACRAASIELGGVEQVKERVRDATAGVLVDALIQDVRYAVRSLRKNPGFATVAILTLALGIGANTAIFSVVNAVLLKPLQTPDAARLVRFVTTSAGGSTQLAFAQEFKVLRQQTSLFEDISAHRLEFVNLTGDTEPEQIPVARVTANFFHVFRAPLRWGRTFTSNEDRPEGDHVAVLSAGFWLRRFVGDPQIIGRTILLGGVPHVVVGVLGPDFDSEQFEPRPDAWVPFQYDLDRKDGGDYSMVTGRLAPGITIETANAKLRLAEAEDRGTSTARVSQQSAWTVQPLQDAMVGSVRSSLNLLFAAVGLVLLIACANVANLLLMRTDIRKREMAIRIATGAGRGRIVRQLLTESVVLSGAGAIVGLIAGTIGIRALLAMYPGNNPFIIANAGITLPRIGDAGSGVAVDGHVLAFAVLVSVVTGIVFGVVPACQAARTDPYVTLQHTSGTAGFGVRRHRARALLAVSEIALALMLVVGAGLLIRTSLALRAVRPGFDADHVLTMRMSLTGTPFETRAGMSELTRDGVQRIRGVPGVTAASTMCCMPLETVWQLPFVVASRPSSGLTRAGNLAFHGFGGWTFVSPGYFDVFKIPLLRGRDFNDRDTAGTPGVVMINQAMARRFWPTSDPLNDRLIIGRGMGPQYEDDPMRQVIGIVGDVRDTGLNRNPRPAMYVPVAQVPDGVTERNVRLLPIVWIVRTAVDPYSLRAPIEKELQRLSGLPLARARSMDAVVSESTARTRFDMWLMTIFGCSALLLAGVGIYGLMAYSVQHRTREIGIRLALGANSGTVRNMILAQGMVLASIGVSLGIAFAFGLARLLATFLFGVTAHDPVIFVSVPVLLGAVALIAVWLPARAATNVDPLVALRCD